MIKEYMEEDELILSIAQKGMFHPILITIDKDENIHSKLRVNYFYRTLV